MSITRDDLYALFIRKDGAHDMGWKIDKDDFPSDKNMLDWDKNTIAPEFEKIFRALEIIRPSEVKYIVVGQDPYPSCVNGPCEGEDSDTLHATGFAFIPSGNSEPRSYLAMRNSIFPPSGNEDDLVNWATLNKVLLLNCSLTVPRAIGTTTTRTVANRHEKPWRCFTSAIIALALLNKPKPKIIGLGKDAYDAICRAHLLSGEIYAYYHPIYSPANGSKRCELHAFDKFNLAEIMSHTWRT